MFRAIDLHKPEKLSSWRKISMGSWRPNGSSSILVKETLDLAEYTLLKESMKQKNQKVSFNAYFSHALGKSLIENPRINSIVRMKRIYPRKNVELFFHVLRDNEVDDLSGIKITHDSSQNYSSLENQFKNKLKECREKDANFADVKRIYKFIPSFVSKCFLDTISFVSYTLNLNLKIFGVPNDSFGSIMVTNVSSLGLELAFTPIAPYTRIPVVIAIGAPSDRCIVKNGKVAISKQLDLGIHFDHRLIDGIQISDFLKSLRKNLIIDQSALAKV